VQEYVSQCNICKQANHEHVRYPGLLQPLHVSQQAWHTVTMDFIKGPPGSKGANCILVVVDKVVTKYAHFLPLSNPYTAHQIALAYVDNVFKLHGLPAVIVLIGIPSSLAVSGRSSSNYVRRNWP
jgi:hypothetical protein